MTTRKPTAPQRRAMENVRAGRLAQHGFPAGKSASSVIGAIVEAGWFEHSMQPTGPALLLTPAGIAALEAP